jgi:ATP/maltotriose-dependent transcriptional regulator MalT
MLRIVQARIAEKPEEAIQLARNAIDLLGGYHGGEQGSAVQALAAALVQQGDLAAGGDACRRAVDPLAVHGRRSEAAAACVEWAKMLEGDGRRDEANAALARAQALHVIHARWLTFAEVVPQMKVDINQTTTITDPLGKVTKDI